MKCFCCNRQKNELITKKSELLSGVDIFICATCLELKHEPRWVIVLAGRQNGSDYVRDFIIKRRYSGNEIFANELIV